MSKRETPLIERYWKRVGCSLMEEYRVGRRQLECRHHPRWQARAAKAPQYISLIVIETKGKRLNRYLAGQARYARPWS